ncbi:Dihydropyrimidine dehydrogenase [Caligus rogercresseyi]|uniref:Dihydropyrimidine dehydrogenase n=1 Tax=Caligus rogercresseyi TaxID=217165 RepID=A0A7T8HJD3_CALRO|nr:Dihydropyrimidine dehydrogenase [Caligus rogercresseyi]
MCNPSARVQNNVLWRHIWKEFTFLLFCSLHFLGTARIFENPFRKTTKTLFAPHRIAEVAQSKAVSPAPRTMTSPYNSGSDG